MRFFDTFGFIICNPNAFEIATGNDFPLCFLLDKINRFSHTFSLTRTIERMILVFLFVLVWATPKYLKYLSLWKMFALTWWFDCIVLYRWYFSSLVRLFVRFLLLLQALASLIRRIILREEWLSLQNFVYKEFVVVRFCRWCQNVFCILLTHIKYVKQVLRWKTQCFYSVGCQNTIREHWHITTLHQHSHTIARTHRIYS